MNIPIMGANMYIPILSKFPATRAGPIDRAGFIDAPVNGPATKEHTEMIPPMEKPIIKLDIFLLDAMLKMLSIRKKLIKISRKKPWDCVRRLRVMPNVWLFPKKYLCENDAAIAPVIWAGI